MTPLQKFAAMLWALFATLPAAGQFGITFEFEGTLSLDQQVIFREAADTWETYITGYQDGIAVHGIDIDADDLLTSDGIGGDIVGLSGPTSALVQDPFAIPIAGAISFDAADIAAMDDDLFRIYATREIGHVLGIGTFWTLNKVYTPGSGQYSGAFGLEAYKKEFDGTATYVPVELAGSNERYWNEVDEGTAPTGLKDPYGRDLGNELMTGWLGPEAAETFISETTIMSLKDLGYLVEYPIPEPSGLLLVPLGTLLLLIRRKR